MTFVLGMTVREMRSFIGLDREAPRAAAADRGAFIMWVAISWMLALGVIAAIVGACWLAVIAMRPLWG